MALFEIEKSKLDQSERLLFGDPWLLVNDSNMFSKLLVRFLCLLLLSGPEEEGGGGGGGGMAWFWISSSITRFHLNVNSLGNLFAEIHVFISFNICCNSLVSST